MPVTRLAFAAIPDAAAQEKAIAMFNDAKNTRLRDGKPYILESRAAKCKAVGDSTTAWNITVSLTFASEADAEYYEKEDPASKEAAQQRVSSGVQAVAVVTEPHA